MSKVIRWHCVGLTPHAANGNFVALENYESLQAALREALDGWKDWLAPTPGAQPDWDRIEVLRAQFLDDK